MKFNFRLTVHQRQPPQRIGGYRAGLVQEHKHKLNQHLNHYPDTARGQLHAYHLLSMPWTAALLYYKIIPHASFFCKKNTPKNKKNAIILAPLRGVNKKTTKIFRAHLHTPATYTPPRQAIQHQPQKSHSLRFLTLRATPRKVLFFNLFYMMSMYPSPLFWEVAR